MQNRNNKFSKTLFSFIYGLLSYVGIVCLALGIPLFLFGSSTPFWEGILICILICIFTFGGAYLLNKYRRHRLSPEERAAEDKENKEFEKAAEKARYAQQLKSISKQFENITRKK